MPQRVSRRFPFAPLLAWSALALAGPLDAQTPTEAELAGTVRTALGEPIQRPVVTVLDGRGETIRSFTGTLDGTFTLRGVGLGIYSVRVDALGFRPQLLVDIALRPGSTTRLDIVLLSGGAGIDTLATASAAAGGGAPTRWLDAPELRMLPTETPALAEWVALSTVAGEDLGVAGLPGQFTSIAIDGLPFRPVRPLGLRTLERGLGLVPGRSVAAAEVRAGPRTLSLPFGAGGGVSVYSTRTERPGVDVDAAGSAGPLWMSSDEPDDAPSIRSLWAGGTATFAPSPDTTSVRLGVDVWQTERPREGLLPSVGGDVAGLGAPYVERRRGAAGFARFDHALSSSASLWGTGRFALQPAVLDLVGMAWGLADTGERVDLLVGGGFVAPMGRRELVEVRIGLGRSGWTAAAPAGADLPFEAGAPTFVDAGSGLRGGPGPIEAESASRLDFDIATSVLIERDAHRVHLGLLGGVASHSQEFGRDPWVRSFVGSGSPEGAWSGGFTARRYGDEFDASIPRLTVFAEDTWRVGRTAALRFGGSWETEWLPIVDSLPNSDWFDASGLTAPALVDQVSGGSGFVDLRWTGAGATRFDLGASYESHEVDPTLVLESLASRDISLIEGVETAPWPAVPSGASSPDAIRSGFAYFVEQPSAPSTVRFSASVSGRLGGIDAAVGGVFRRSDGLTRRRDLNRPAVPHGTDGNGRALWAQPRSAGAWLGPDPATSSRFTAFGPVLEIDQGGWSEYLGLTARFGYVAAGGVQFLGEYTWSRTEDNVPGIAAQGRLAGVPMEAAFGEEATEGRSDLDVPHRASARVVVPLPFGTESRLAAVYRYRSGLPFTPGYAAGVDANLDGVVGNDPAFVTDAVAAAFADWACLDDDRGDFATRNGCRRDPVQTLDLRLEVGLAGVSVFVDGLNVLDSEISVLDTALLGVQPGAGPSSVGPDTALPFETNDGFGTPLRNRSPGRMLRLGVRVGR